MSYKVNLDQNRISALFFNHRNENYDALFGDEAPDYGIGLKDNPVVAEAVKKDAAAFAAMIGLDREHNKWEIETFINWLTEDFLDRL